MWGWTTLVLRAEQQGVVNVGPTMINKIDYQAFGDHLHFQAKWKHIYFGCWVSGGWGILWAYGRLTLLLEKMISIKSNICFRLASMLSINLCTNLRTPWSSLLLHLMFLYLIWLFFYNWKLWASGYRLNLKCKTVSGLLLLSLVRPSLGSLPHTARMPAGWSGQARPGQVECLWAPLSGTELVLTRP